MKKLHVLSVLGAVLSFGSGLVPFAAANEAMNHKMMMEKMDSEMKSCMEMPGMNEKSCHDKMMMSDSKMMMDCKEMEGMNGAKCTAEMKKMMSGKMMKKKM